MINYIMQNSNKKSFFEGGEYMDISNNIRILRKKRGLNQFELSEEIGVSVDSVRRWESNKQFPRADELRNLASVLGVTVDELLNGSESNKIKITLVYDWDKMREGSIDMNMNDFELILGSQGQIGLKGSGKFTSKEDINEFLSRVKEQLEIAFSAQLQRGAIQEA